MAPSIAPGQTVRDPTTQDKNAVIHLYGTPEPSTFFLFGCGLAVVGALRRLWRRN